MHVTLGQILGVVIVITVWLLQPDDERYLTTPIENLRRKVEKQKLKTKSTVTRNLQTISRMLSRLLDEYFGIQIISLNVIYVSVCLSTLGFVFGMPLAFTLLFHRPYLAYSHWIVKWSAAIVGAMVIVGLMYRWKTVQKVLTVAVIVAIIGRMIMIDGVGFMNPYFQQSVRESAFAFGSSLATDVLFLYVTRKLLNRASNTPKTSSIICIGVINCLIAILFIWVPAEIQSLQIRYHWFEFIGEGGYEATFYNLFDAIFCLCLVLMAGVFGLHLMFWPFIERNLKSLKEYNFIKLRWVFFPIGVLLIATRPVWPYVKKVFHLE